MCKANLFLGNAVRNRNSTGFLRTCFLLSSFIEIYSLLMFPVVQGFYNKFLNQVEALRGERTLAAEIGQCFLSLSLSVLKFNPFLITFLNMSYFFCFSNSYVNLVSVLSCLPVKGNLELPAALETGVLGGFTVGAA